MSGQPSSSKSAATTVMPYVCVALLIPACSDTSVNVPSPLLRKSERSEEHTSELQSQSNLVCRLLLEKKKHVACRAPVMTVDRGLRVRLEAVRQRESLQQRWVVRPDLLSEERLALIPVDPVFVDQDLV